MKNRSLPDRLRFALAGIRAAFRNERSFRAQSGFGLAAFILLLALRPKPVWWALVSLTVGAVLAAELINTALESLLDKLHPETNPLIARAKDCAAGAVLILALASLAVAASLVWDRFN